MIPDPDSEQTCEVYCNVCDRYYGEFPVGAMDPDIVCGDCQTRHYYGDQQSMEQDFEAWTQEQLTTSLNRHQTDHV